jgi:alpha-glucosidase
MKRRGFLMGGAGALAATALPNAVSSQSPAPTAETHSLGDFLLTPTATGLQVAHQKAPDRIIWDTVADGDFLTAEIATAAIREFARRSAPSRSPTPYQPPSSNRPLRPSWPTATRRR